MDKIMKLQYEAADSSVTELKDINSSFASGTLKVCYTGKNRNKSDISKETIENAIPSIYNVPIVCHWDRDLGTIGGHDVDIEVDNGVAKMVNLTWPCGVVPESATYRFETANDKYGVEHEYLVIDGVLLWKRQDVFEHITGDLEGCIDHSMEIKIKNGAMNKSTGYYEVSDFEFQALCLLENHEPCFEGSELTLFSLDGFKEKMEEMMSELKETLTNNLNAQVAEDTHPHEEFTKGGESTLEDKMKLVADYGIEVESLDFSIEDFSIEELTEKFEAMKNEQTTEENAEREEENEEFELASNIKDEIRKALHEKKFVDRWGDEIEEFSFEDYDGEKSEVYCWHRRDWNLYALSYSMDNDDVVIDFDSKRRVKFAIVDFVEGEEQASPFIGMYEELSNKIDNLNNKFSESSASLESANAELEEVNSKYSEAESELNTLREFKKNVELEEAKSVRSDVFSNFTDLEGIDAFTELKENCLNYSVEECEEKCYALRGRYGTQMKFTATPSSIKMPIEKDNKDVSDEPYGGVVEKYLNK